MSTNEYPIATLARHAGVGPIRMIRAKAVARETAHTLNATARDALFAYTTTGSAVASLAIIAAPHVEMLLRCIPMVGDERARPPAHLRRLTAPRQGLESGVVSAFSSGKQKL